MSEDTNESRQEDSTNDEYDEDNSISFEKDTESTSSQEEDKKRALRIATQSLERWTRRAAEWNPRTYHLDKNSKKSRKTSQEMGRRPE